MEFLSFQKIPRLFRDIVITEKIDGTNGQIFISESGQITAGSKNRWINPFDDNFGFAAWVEKNRTDLLQLGPGHHFGEWWGLGIQRKYGKDGKIFSLFNVRRWCLHSEEPRSMPTLDPNVTRLQNRLPACCSLVPVLYEGPFSLTAVDRCMEMLECFGSKAAPGFMKPEGVVVFHTASGHLYKTTLGGDGAKTIGGKR